MAGVDDYALLDVGDGARLERFGARITDRPHAGVLGARRAPDRWAAADLRFDRTTGWTAAAGATLDPWTVRVGELDLGLRPTDAGQVGLFPEHVGSLGWLTGQVAARVAAAAPDAPPPAVLHLFAYTGLATLAMARAGRRGRPRRCLATGRHLGPRERRAQRPGRPPDPLARRRRAGLRGPRGPSRASL